MRETGRSLDSCGWPAPWPCTPFSSYAAHRNVDLAARSTRQSGLPTCFQLSGRVLQAAPDKMTGTVGFVGCGALLGLAPEPALGSAKCRVRAHSRTPARRARPEMSAAGGSGDNETMSDKNNEIEAMRARLAGLFSGDEAAEEVRSGFFDGAELRRVLRERFTVEYDVQPVVRNDRVYIHILWRYFEQVSFYMEEDEWAQHTEAVADLLKKWGAVDYFCDYISSVKKRPVVGICM